MDSSQLNALKNKEAIKPLNICLDLGSDSLKVSFGYLDKNRKVVFGKIIEKTFLFQTTIPSSAFYDEETKKWLYGYDIDRQADNSFVNVVKIKGLMSLLIGTGEQDVDLRNKNYYYSGHDFPKFFFPVKITDLNNQNDFLERVKKGKLHKKFVKIFSFLLNQSLIIDLRNSQKKEVLMSTNIQSLLSIHQKLVENTLMNT